MIDQAALAKAKKDLEIGIQETLAENPEMSESDIWYDLVVAFALDLDDDTAREFCRTEVGSIPHDLKDRLGDKDWIR
jgi:hypothetical protein